MSGRLSLDIEFRDKTRCPQCGDIGRLVEFITNDHRWYICDNDLCPRSQFMRGSWLLGKKGR